MVQCNDGSSRFNFIWIWQIVKSVLENYRTEESVVGGDRHASQHNWVDEIARSEGRPGLGGGNDVNISSTTVRLRPARNPSALTRSLCMLLYLLS